MADVKSLQTRLASSLDAVGYKKSVPTLPSRDLERNDKLRSFLEQCLDHVKADSYLSPDQLKCYEDMRSAGKLVEGQELEDALKKLSDEQPAEDIEREITEMREKAASLKKQLQTLNSVQKSLGDHHATLLHKHDELTRQKSDMLKYQHSAQHKSEDGNRKFDRAVEDLMAAVSDLCAFHRREPGDKVQATPPRFLSEVSQDGFHQAEDKYLSELTAYTKKQFFKGLADVAYGRAPGEAGFTQVDLDDADQVLLMGVTEEQHQEHRQELSRLQALYPKREVQHINTQMARAHAEAATSRAQQELEALGHVSTEDLTCESLRQMFAERQQKVERLRLRVQELGQTQLTGLLQDMATLQVTRVLHGDYDLKLARQDYFTSKQDKVISHLQSQRSRQELLSMLYEVELRKHRDTHRLLATAEKQLTQLKEEGVKRNEVMQSQAIRRVDTPRVSIDSQDSLSNSLCALLGVRTSEAVPVLTHASLLKAVEQLAHQLATLQAVLANNDAEMKQLCKDRHSLAADFERALFGHHSEQVGRPELTVKEYTQQCSELNSMVTSLEQNIKKLLKDYDGKKKILQADPLLDTERKLYVYFFTRPAKLTQTVADLAKRVDSMALASRK